MPSIKFFGNHEFVTHGIWVQKGRKKVFIDAKIVPDFISQYEIENSEIIAFSSRRKDGGLFLRFEFGRKNAVSGSEFSITRSSTDNTFTVSIKGPFIYTLSDTEVSMIFYNGQQIEDLDFSLEGISFGDILEGGGVSRIDMWDADIDSEIFPQIDFEYNE